VNRWFARLAAILERVVPTMRDQDLRVRYLDGLRGFAAFVVLLSHVSIVAFPSIFNGLPEMARLRWEWRLAGTPLDLLWAANFAVCIFFVMSALVLSAFCEKEGTNFVANSVRRYIRLTVPILAASGSI
jgi:peptidoglycan/LPS O-acetylase OafA/YrhL